MYSNGLSEVIIGKAIKQHNLPREKIVIMTKVSYLPFQKPIMIITPRFLTLCQTTSVLSSWDQAQIQMQLDMSINMVSAARSGYNNLERIQTTRKRIPQHIFDSIKSSLKRLQLDYVDVFQCKSGRI